MKKLIFSLSLLAVISVVILFSCTRNGPYFRPPFDSGSPQNFSLYLANDSSFYDSVFITIKSVSVLIDTCAKDSGKYTYFDQVLDRNCGDWISLNMTPGQYNLKALSNGIDTLLASGTKLPAGGIKGIQMALGNDSTDNYLILDGTRYNLYFGNKDSATVTIPLQGNEPQQTGSNSYSLWLYFDIPHSIYIGPDGKYYFYPVILWSVKKSNS